MPMNVARDFFFAAPPTGVQDEHASLARGFMLLSRNCFQSTKLVAIAGGSSPFSFIGSSIPRLILFPFSGVVFTHLLSQAMASSFAEKSNTADISGAFHVVVGDVGGLQLRASAKPCMRSRASDVLECFTIHSPREQQTAEEGELKITTYLEEDRGWGIYICKENQEYLQNNITAEWFWRGAPPSEWRRYRSCDVGRTWWCRQLWSSNADVAVYAWFFEPTAVSGHDF